MRPVPLFLPLLTALAACGPAAPRGNNQTNSNAGGLTNVVAPTSARSPDNLAAAGGPLSGYVGRLPSDAVNGVTFLANPRVRTAVEAAVSDAEVRRWVLREDVSSNPIASRDGRLIAMGCEAHNCGPRHWSIVIDTDGTNAEVCYAHNSPLDRGTWYVRGRPPEERRGDCPSAG